MKNKKRALYLMLVISFILVGFNSSQSRLNINHTDDRAIKYFADNTKYIGPETYAKIIQNKPYDTILDIKQLDSVGHNKIKIIQKYFDTSDFKLRKKYYVLSLITMILLNVISFFYLLKIHLRNARIKENFNAIIEKMKMK